MVAKVVSPVKKRLPDGIRAVEVALDQRPRRHSGRVNPGPEDE
jgi:hypothetical protein